MSKYVEATPEQVAELTRLTERATDEQRVSLLMAALRDDYPLDMEGRLEVARRIVGEEA